MSLPLPNWFGTELDLADNPSYTIGTRLYISFDNASQTEFPVALWQRDLESDAVNGGNDVLYCRSFEPFIPQLIIRRQAKDRPC
jgi:hypothetical protein